jgi:hypothetical protein
MITETFASKRPKATYWPTTYPLTSNIPKHFTAQEIAQAEMRGITPEEYVRRDNIVKRLSSLVQLRAGDTCYPSNKDGYAKYGCCFVVGVCRSYKDFSADSKWPKNDTPMVVTFASSLHPNQHMICTHHYMERRNLHDVTC